MMCIKYITIREERPYRGYSVRKVTASNLAIKNAEFYLCEIEGKRSVLATTAAMAKRAIDAREGFLKEGAPEDESQTAEP